MAVNPLPNQKADNHACRQGNSRRQACPHPSRVVHRRGWLTAGGGTTLAAGSLSGRGMPQRRARIRDIRRRRQNFARRQGNRQIVVFRVFTLWFVFGHLRPYPSGAHSSRLRGWRTRGNTLSIPAFSITQRPRASQLLSPHFALVFTNSARTKRIVATLPRRSRRAATTERFVPSLVCRGNEWETQKQRKQEDCPKSARYSGALRRDGTEHAGMVKYSLAQREQELFPYRQRFQT